MAGRKQFDVDAALDRAMQVFWQYGYADASLDLLGTATGLGRGSLYGAFGGKDELFRKCLDRYSAKYGALHEEALAAHPGEPARTVEAFFEVVLQRIADPSVPDGCLIAQSASQSPTLKEDSQARVQALLAGQRERVRAALAGSGADATDLEAGDLDAEALEDLATYVVAVNQSLAVMSRAGTSGADLRAVARIACATVEQAFARTGTGTAAGKGRRPVLGGASRSEVT